MTYKRDVLYCVSMSWVVSIKKQNGEPRVTLKMKIGDLIKYIKVRYIETKRKLLTQQY